MVCLHCQSPFLPFHSQLKPRQKLKAEGQLWLFCKAPPSLVLQRQTVNSFVPLRTNSQSIAAIPPSQSGDKCSALLLVVYLLANFVAPYFISKYFEFDKVREDQKRNEK
ncbi:uncharacterized protein LOC110419928 isoform X2 [Herrania umbratica]|uniref:Uncharacterized protein LOC110419928 isoform X2 n=1 Tax=Herrania umbratica TaxID=108875 RepID=A0A6J1AP20_9ROSI|nr:uncharacterized protein LOC110419928 isoform X2 [Herrania umbratica]